MDKIGKILAEAGKNLSEKDKTVFDAYVAGQQKVKTELKRKKGESDQDYEARKGSHAKQSKISNILSEIAEGIDVGSFEGAPVYTGGRDFMRGFSAGWDGSMDQVVSSGGGGGEGSLLADVVGGLVGGKKEDPRKSASNVEKKTKMMIKDPAEYKRTVIDPSFDSEGGFVFDQHSHVERAAGQEDAFVNPFTKPEVVGNPDFNPTRSIIKGIGAGLYETPSETREEAFRTLKGQ